MCDTLGYAALLENVPFVSGTDPFPLPLKRFATELENWVTKTT